MKQPPLLTIGVPTYRGVDRLRSLFASYLLAEWADRTEMIVVDDGTPEPEATRIADLCASFRVKLLRHPECRGCSPAYNAIFPAAKAPVVALFDNDTLIPKSWIPSALRLWNAMKDHVGVLSWLSKSPGDPDPSHRRELLEPATELAGYCYLLSVANWQAMGGFDESMKRARHDSDMCCRLAQAGKPSYRVTYPVVPHLGNATIHGLAAEIGTDIAADVLAFDQKWGQASSSVEAGLLLSLQASGALIG